MTNQDETMAQGAVGVPEIEQEALTAQAETAVEANSNAEAPTAHAEDVADNETELVQDPAVGGDPASVEAEDQSAAEASAAPVAEETVVEASAEPVSEETVVEASAAPVAEETVAVGSAEPVSEETVAVGSAAPVSEETVADSAVDEAEAVADSTPEAPVAEAEQDGDADEEAKKVVRILAVGQQVKGTVKRITEFGAFIDIGVGRDGLIHISELSLNRVAKVTDVLSENLEIEPWIKKLDRKRNRISLTLIDPEMKTIRDLNEGEIVKGTVTRILPYGAFIDIGIGRDALLHVREMSNKFVEKPEEIVSVGQEIETRIIELSRRRGRVDLSLKGLIEEEEEEPVVDQISAGQELEEEYDEFEDVEVLSPMELAFKKAVEADGGEVRVSKKSGRKSGKQNIRAIQDEIIARTLDTRST